MDELIIFRIFLTFPLIGVIIPRLDMLFPGAKGTIGVSAVITSVSLLLSIAVCSIGIWYNKYKNAAQNDAAISL